jgi:predicted glutamine amidotransferase
VLARRSRAIYGAIDDIAADRRKPYIVRESSIVAHTASRTSRSLSKQCTHPWTRILHAISEHNLAQLSGFAVDVEDYK